MYPYLFPMSTKENRKNPINTGKSTVCNRKNDPEFWKDPRPVEDFCFKPAFFVKTVLSPLDRKVLNYILHFKQVFKQLYTAQSTIARHLGASREEVNRSISRLRTWGLIKTNYRHFQTSVYKVSSLFSLKRVKRQLAKLLTALRNNSYHYLTQLNFFTREYLYKKACHVMYRYLTYIRKRETQDLIQNLFKTSKIPKTLPKFPPPVCPSKTGPVPGYITKRRVMTPEEVKERADAVEEASKVLMLSLYGKARLTIYPAIAIREALKSFKSNLKRGKKITKPYGFVCNRANDATKILNLEPDYHIFDQYKLKHDFQYDEEPHIPGFYTHYKRLQEDIKAKQKEKPLPAAYKPYQTKEDNIDYYQEVLKFERTEKLPDFEHRCNLFQGKKAFYACKNNMIRKALEHASEEEKQELKERYGETI